MYTAELFKNKYTTWRFIREWVNVYAYTLKELQAQIIELKNDGYTLARVYNKTNYKIYER